MDLAVKLFYWLLVITMGANIFALVYLGKTVCELKEQVRRIERRR